MIPPRWPLCERQGADDRAAPALLHESAAAFYDRFAGDPGARRRLLARAYRHPGHTASFDICRVAERDGAVVGIVAGFAAEEADRLARRFLLLTVPRLPPARWPTVARQLREARRLTPAVPAGAWYVDALAVAASARRTGIARSLLEDAEARARARGGRACSRWTPRWRTRPRARCTSRPASSPAPSARLAGRRRGAGRQRLRRLSQAGVTASLEQA